MIKGITGQDGAYLAEPLLEKGYTVHGIQSRTSTLNTDRIDQLYKDQYDPNARLLLHHGDPLTDSMNITRIIQETQPDEIYYFGAMSHVKVSFETPEYTANTDGIESLWILEAIWLLGLGKKNQILPNFYLQIVWYGSGSFPNGKCLFLSKVTLWCGKVICQGGGKF